MRVKLLLFFWLIVSCSLFYNKNHEKDIGGDDINDTVTKRDSDIIDINRTDIKDIIDIKILILL